MFKWKKKPPPGLVPYMDPVELSQMLAIVETLQPARVLEWGSGGSTKLLLERCPFITRFVSIEHDQAWFERMRDLVTDPRLSLQHIPPEHGPGPSPSDKDATKAWHQKAEVDPSLFTRYVAYPTTLGETFDFVIVDGRARAFCIEAGWPLVRPGGVLMVHDAQRPAYHGAVHRTGGRVSFLEPYYNGQICIVRKAS